MSQELYGSFTGLRSDPEDEPTSRDRQMQLNHLKKEKKLLKKRLKEKKN